MGHLETFSSHTCTHLSRTDHRSHVTLTGLSGENKTCLSRASNDASYVLRRSHTQKAQYARTTGHPGSSM